MPYTFPSSPVRQFSWVGTRSCAEKLLKPRADGRPRWRRALFVSGSSRTLVSGSLGRASTGVSSAHPWPTAHSLHSMPESAADADADSVAGFSQIIQHPCSAGFNPGYGHYPHAAPLRSPGFVLDCAPNVVLFADDVMRPQAKAPPVWLGLVIRYSIASMAVRHF